MTDQSAKLLTERVADLEVTVRRLTDEVGLLSERLMQATQAEEILKRAHAEAT